MFGNASPTFTGTANFHVTGMTCEHCKRAVEAEVSAVPGVGEVDVHLESGVVSVNASRPVTHAQIAAAVDEAGYRLAS